MNTSPNGTIWSPPDDQLSQIVAKGLRDYGSLSEKERVRFVATFMASFLLAKCILKWREGLLLPLWLGWELVIMNLVCAPGARYSENGLTCWR